MDSVQSRVFYRRLRPAKRSHIAPRFLSIILILTALLLSTVAVTASPQSGNAIHENGVTIKVHDLNSVRFSSMDLVQEQYTQAAQISTNTTPVFLTGLDENIIAPGPTGQGYVTGDIGVQTNFSFASSPRAVIGIAVQFTYHGPQHQHSYQVTEYVELASSMQPVNFSVTTDLGSVYTVHMMKVTLISDPWVNPTPQGAQNGLSDEVMPPPIGSTLVVNVYAHVTMDEDLGTNGWWAINNYTVFVQIWAQPGGSVTTSWLYDISYIGTSTTYSGVLSPGLPQSVEGAKALTYFSGYVGRGLAAFYRSPNIVPPVVPNHPTEPAFGYIGQYNFGGSVANLTTASVGGSSPPNPINWTGIYLVWLGPAVPDYGFVHFYTAQTWIDANYLSPVYGGNIVSE